MDDIPRPTGGVLHVVASMARDPLVALPQFAEECGDTYAVDMPLLPTVVIQHPKDVHHVLVRDHRSYRKDWFTRQLRSVLGDGLLTAEGVRWRRNRRLAQPAMHMRAIRGYATTMTTLTDAAVDGWGPRRQVDVHHEMMQLTLRIVARTLFGHDIGDQADRVGHALDVFMQVYLGVGGSGIRMPEWVPTPGNRRAARARDDLDAVVYGIIDEHRRGERDPDTLLGMFIAASDEDGGLTNQELRDESLTMLMAGHETTANALTMAMYLLSQNPNAEERLHAELDAVCGDRMPTLGDIDALPFTKAVVQESMRLYPPAWAIAREAILDTEVAGYRIERGTQVWMSQWMIHRDARWYPDPLAFQPERWLGDLHKTLPDCAYLPFSAGPRACIGKRFAEMEALLVLATMARRVSLRLEPGETLSLIPSITLRPGNGLRMVATSRIPRSAAA